jgi:hypothetical protein
MSKLWNNGTHRQDVGRPWVNINGCFACDFVVLDTRNVRCALGIVAEELVRFGDLRVLSELPVDTGTRESLTNYQTSYRWDSKTPWLEGSDDS